MRTIQPATKKAARKAGLILTVVDGEMRCYDPETTMKIGVRADRPDDGERWIQKMKEKRDQKLRKDRHDSEKLYDTSQ